MWKFGEPNNGNGGEHCGMILKRFAYTLNDVVCSGTSPGICQMQTELILNWDTLFSYYIQTVDW